MNPLFDSYSLQEIAALYSDLVGTLPAIIYLTKPKSPFATIYVNHHVSILGYTEEEWLSRADFWMTILHPSDRDRVLENAKSMSEENGDIKLEYRVYGKGGKVFWIQEIGRYVLGKDGHPICRQGALIDITERKIAELEREELLTQLQAAQTEIKTLNGLIPICAYCSKVRNDKNYWRSE